MERAGIKRPQKSNTTLIYENSDVRKTPKQSFSASRFGGASAAENGPREAFLHEYRTSLEPGIGIIWQKRTISMIVIVANESQTVIEFCAAMELSLRDAGQAPQRAPLRSEVLLDWCKGTMSGDPIQESFKTLHDLKAIFSDHVALAAMDPGREVYRVRWWAPVERGTEGGLWWGVTVLQPGKVGDEYFMTHGHFHANRSRAEYYGTVSGNGMLLQMNPDRSTWAEVMAAGSLHYVRGENAHRIANTGNSPLVVWACWPSDAGYDYAPIAERGFGARLVESDGQPVLLEGN